MEGLRNTTLFSCIWVIVCERQFTRTDFWITIAIQKPQNRERGSNRHSQYPESSEWQAVLQHRTLQAVLYSTDAGYSQLRVQLACLP